jgi:hypothetical protein
MLRPRAGRASLWVAPVSTTCISPHPDASHFSCDAVRFQSGRTEDREGERVGSADREFAVGDGDLPGLREGGRQHGQRALPTDSAFRPARAALHF